MGVPFFSYQSFQTLPQGAMPTAYSTASATTATNSDMINPCTIGRRPARYKILKLVFRPIAPGAASISILLISLSQTVTSAEIIPALVNADIAKNPTMNYGKIEPMLTVTLPLSHFSLRSTYNSIAAIADPPQIPVSDDSPAHRSQAVMNSTSSFSKIPMQVTTPNDFSDNSRSSISR